MIHTNTRDWCVVLGAVPYTPVLCMCMSRIQNELSRCESKYPLVKKYNSLACMYLFMIIFMF